MSKSVPIDDFPLENLIKISADSIGQLRLVDVFRVLESANVRRNQLADYIVENRANLVNEVQSVMAEEFPLNEWQLTSSLPETAAPIVIPEKVLNMVGLALESLREIKLRLDEAVQLGARYGGGDRYVNDTLSNRSTDIERANKTIAAFKKNAASNNIDAEQILKSMGGLPVLVSPVSAIVAVEAEPVNKTPWTGTSAVFSVEQGKMVIRDSDTGDEMPDFSGVAYEYLSKTYVLTEKLHGERSINYLSAKTVEEATKEVPELKARIAVMDIVSELGGTLSPWEKQGENWKYANLSHGDTVVRIGLSTGGVVQVNRDPFTPLPERQMNITEDAIRKSIVAALPVKEAAAPSISVDHLAAVISLTRPINDVPENWIVMNAPRPLLGDATIDGSGDFLHGRWYAAIDPAGEQYALQYIDRNMKDDARVVFVADKKAVIGMALQLVGDPEYQRRYMEMEEGDDDLLQILSHFVDELRNKTVGELKELVALGVPHFTEEVAATDTSMEYSAKTPVMSSSNNDFSM